MRQTKNTCLALALLLGARAAAAADLCDGPCSASLGFPAGGSISAVDGATITFGPEGGLLDLGEGGSLTLGEGGSMEVLEGAPDNMSQGGTLTLGPGGSIQFGPNGSLATGDQGGLAVPDGSALDVAATGPIVVDSEAAVQMGNLHAAGTVEITSGGNVSIGMEPIVPLHLSTTGDSGSTIQVTSAGDVSTGEISAGSSITVTANSIGFGAGSVDVAEGESGAGYSSGSGFQSSSGTATFTDNGYVFEPVTLGVTEAPDGPVGIARPGTMGLFGMLLGLAVALARRRR
jgi:hypothetical protein